MKGFSLRKDFDRGCLPDVRECTDRGRRGRVSRPACHSERNEVKLKNLRSIVGAKIPRLVTLAQDDMRF